ncbi:MULTISPECIES: ATP-grasp domain-containing protein [unclassified Streptomyces]|uniref:ATP-grasp domain-containing protein n=1 Tax=unclassified Streptomyces TaxID=2593676 RepID=UPI000DB1AD48|nr:MULTISPECIES: ATP-grasp domain-containing protein [unclassified Streptomyces]PZT72277.1 carboxylate--amine ligase [Streptomyces sp. AC1-42T]PZT81400.1 carboxylate--amine ligase [Streptomyces sp. AC1-42W]
MPSWGRDQLGRLSEQAKRRDLRLVGADYGANLAKATPQEHAVLDETVELDIRNPEACRAWAAGRKGFDAVITIAELSVLPAAAISHQLGLPGNDPEAVRRIRYKDRCRQLLREAGFPQPESAVCHSLADARRFVSATAPGPWVLKPRDGLASIGVRLVADPKDLPAAVAQASRTSFKGPSSAPATASAPPARATDEMLRNTPPFLIETHVDGAEYSAEGVFVQGVPRVLGLTRKEVTTGFISTSQRMPSGLTEASTEDARSTVERALNATGITRGAFHVELWLTRTGVVLGEFHIRTGGDFIHALVEHTRPGLEFYGTHLDDLLDNTPAPTPPMTRAARVQFLFPPPGTLRAVHGWDKLTNHPAVLNADLMVAPGDTIPSIPDSFTRSGVLVVGADTTNDADALTEELTEQVVFEMR